MSYYSAYYESYEANGKDKRRSLKIKVDDNGKRDQYIKEIVNDKVVKEEGNRELDKPVKYTFNSLLNNALTRQKLLLPASRSHRLPQVEKGQSSNRLPQVKRGQLPGKVKSNSLPGRVKPSSHSLPQSTSH